ncbi:hypothetical protein CspHIS471_0211710 [Cutaneotrichosporon sp. HIS471]|nr:hypothetical protein CspHIS471_0211710 [Cutaneotrichosporon sp. HIS471]
MRESCFANDAFVGWHGTKPNLPAPFETGHYAFACRKLDLVVLCLSTSASATIRRVVVTTAGIPKVAPVAATPHNLEPPDLAALHAITPHLALLADGDLMDATAFTVRLPRKFFAALKATTLWGANGNRYAAVTGAALPLLELFPLDPEAASLIWNLLLRIASGGADSDPNVLRLCAFDALRLVTPDCSAFAALRRLVTAADEADAASAARPTFQCVVCLDTQASVMPSACRCFKLCRGCATSIMQMRNGVRCPGCHTTELVPRHMWDVFHD